MKAIDIISQKKIHKRSLSLHKESINPAGRQNSLGEMYA